jgi:hypothetical protein
MTESERLVDAWLRHWVRSVLNLVQPPGAAESNQVRLVGY